MKADAPPRQAATGWSRENRCGTSRTKKRETLGLMHSAGPAVIDTLADARALHRLARRAETQCGDGKMVWHIWGEGEPIVLVHGGSGNWGHWARNIGPLVRAGRAVYVPDLPGCGLSAPPPFGHDGDVLPPWIETGVAALLGDRAFDLVGFSFGAMVSGFYAAQFSARVKKLLLVGAPALSATPGPKAGLQEWLRLPDGSRREAAFRHNLRALMVARDETVDDLALGLYVEALKQDRLTKRRMAATDVLLRTMPQISAPVWGVWGAEDVLWRGRFDQAEAGLRRAQDFRRMTLVADAGHWVQFEQADVFNDWLRAALSE